MPPFAGQLSQGLTHPSQGQTGQNGEFPMQLSRERPFCPVDGVNLSQRQIVCPRHSPTQNANVYWYLVMQVLVGTGYHVWDAHCNLVRGSCS